MGKTAEIYSLIVLEARSRKSRCQQYHAPSKASREESFLTSSIYWLLPEILGIPWLRDVLCQSLPPFSHGLLLCAAVTLCQYFPLLIMTPVILDLEPTLIQYDLMLT